MGQLIADLDVAPDCDADELAEFTQRLREQLLDLDVDSVNLVAEEAGPGAKGMGLLGIGGLIVRFSVRSDLVRAIVDRVVEWLSRQSVRSVKLTLDSDSLEVTGVSSAEQQQLIDLWVARHAGPA
jgi:hypothetical protein